MMQFYAQQFFISTDIDIDTQSLETSILGSFKLENLS